MVYNKLCNLKPDKSPGPEGWPVLALKETAQELLYLFHFLSYSTNHFSPPQFPTHGNKLLLLPSIRRENVLRQKIIVYLALHQQ